MIRKNKKFLMQAALLFLLAFVAANCWGPPLVFGQGESKPRQYYGMRGWHKDAGKDYFSHYYYYKTRPLDRSYKEQVIVYQPSRTTQWVYWYNPDTGKFWARCPTGYNSAYTEGINAGQDYWSYLPEKYQGNDLSKINDRDFLPVVPREANPALPGCSDGVKITSFPLGKKYLPETTGKD